MAAEPVRSSPPRWRRLLLLALIAEAALLGGLVKDEVTRVGNETSRFVVVERLVEARTFVIEGSLFETVDRARIGGRFYSNKPLLLPVWLAGVYWPFHHLLGWSFAEQRHSAILVVTLFGVTLWSVVLSALFAQRLRRHGASDGTAIALGLAVVLGTWVLSYGTTVNNHTPAAAALFALLVCLERALEGAAAGWRWPLAAGLLAAALAAVDMPTGGAFAAAGLGALLQGRRGRERWSGLLAYVAGGAVVAAVLAAINLVAYGNVLPAYFIPGAFDFPGHLNSGRWGGPERPDAVLPNAFHQLFGARGVFSHQPALLFAIPFLLRWRRLPLLERWSAAAVLPPIVFYATMVGDFGSWAYGFRFLVPLVPLFFWWAARWTLAQRLAWRVAFAALCVVGVVTSAIGALNPWPVVYEGTGTVPGAVEHHVRSPLLANLLMTSFVRDPGSPAFRALAAHYGPRVTAGYLQKAAVNLRRPDLLRAATRWAREVGVVPPVRAPASAPAAAPPDHGGAPGGRAGSTAAPPPRPRDG